MILRVVIPCFLIFFWGSLLYSDELDHEFVEECAPCHLNDSPQQHYFPRCVECHKPGSWDDVGYEHHLEMKCIRCHTVPRSSRNHWTGECSFCHNTDDWGNAS